VKKVFLTGSGGLIGSHFAELLQESEAIDPVFLVSGLTNSGEKLSSENVITKNLSKESSLDGLADEIYRRYGDIDVLVNNAAITTQNGIQTFANDTSDKRIQDVFQAAST
jgi:NAD(P)-dependent dehydrogenase (short-subunit alcohol dehydrogenase family)